MYPDDIVLAQKKDQLSNMLCGDVQVRGAYPNAEQIGGNLLGGVKNAT